MRISMLGAEIRRVGGDAHIAPSKFLIKENIMEEQTKPQVRVVDVQFRPGQKVYFFDPGNLALVQGDHVIIDTARGAEFGICASGIHTITEKEVVAPLRRVLRKTTPQDEKIVADNRAKEKRAEQACMQKIQVHNLDMQLVSAECAFDGSKILFYFTADERVDFRELVKDLAGIFHTRIELRQIGVRDKAKMVGGLGICGRPFCCASFLDDFQPVSIKMAKSQNLSLNPTKISGTCGRLMCCLKYEQDTYEALIRTSPKLESFVDTPDGRGTVIEADILRQRVKVRMESNPDTVNTYENEEIAVLRSGKAKKTDAPIPADLAPISGSGAPRKKKETPQEDAMVLEPIRFRYSTESVVDESPKSVPEAQGEEPAAQEERSPRPRRQDRPRGRRRENQGDTPYERSANRPGEKREPRENRPPRPRRQDRPREETAPEAAQQPNRPPRRRNNYRGPRKPSKPQE